MWHPKIFTTRYAHHHFKYSLTKILDPPLLNTESWLGPRKIAVPASTRLGCVHWHWSEQDQPYTSKSHWDYTILILPMDFLPKWPSLKGTYTNITVQEWGKPEKHAGFSPEVFQDLIPKQNHNTV